LPRKSERQEVLSAFGEILSPQTAEAVVSHRVKLRKPLTAHAARLLAKQLSKASDPEEAANTMMVRGWIGFDPSWGDSQRGGQGPPSKPKPSGRASLIDALDRRYPDEPSPAYPRLAG
jgi:hypothetical protein